MNAGLLLKSARETAVLLLIVSSALAIVEAIFSGVLPGLVQDIGAQVLQIPFIRTIFQALLGTDVGDMMVPEAIVAIAWVHPAVLALVWTYAVVFCTRVPAAEIERGSIDVLFGLPVSRWRVWLAEAAVFLVTGAVLLVLAMIGHRLGMLWMNPEQRPAMGRMFGVVSNLYCLYVAVGGAAFAISALSDRRGRATAGIFGLLLGSFLLSFLAQFWAPAKVV
ncbi:MAG: hypothetical protein GTN60_21285, partial [Pseudomonas stutzeri]|nr:hypothetical protein [Stutzerimonas stutzeri]NIM69296.1 hypothetical protein [Xanthomonadales bacterium]NIN83074.1 hypothetical protein [Stutzerimonas stutzeri]NIO13113.1 hypothetical protein [Xanthomonadales bacterium]NIP03210.1 hypothetical protein [Stutzerimonas stutzeri]